MEENLETTEVEFNMGIAMLKRIDTLLNSLVVAKMRQDLRVVYDLLFLIESEVQFLFKKEDVDQLNKYKERINKIIESNPNIWFIHRLPVLDQNTVKGFSIVSNILLEWDQTLRKKMHEVGLLIPEKYHGEEL